MRARGFTMEVHPAEPGSTSAAFTIRVKRWYRIWLKAKVCGWLALDLLGHVVCRIAIVAESIMHRRVRR